MSSRSQSVNTEPPARHIPRIAIPEASAASAQSDEHTSDGPAPSPPGAPDVLDGAAGFSFHPLAAMFPPLEGAAFEAFVEDLRANRQQEAAWTYGGQLIDGRTRARACERLGIPLETREWDGHGSLTAFVLSHNLHRRHLDESQRALVAAKAQRALVDEVRALKTAVARRGPAGKQSAAGQVCPDGPAHESHRQAGELLNVSPRSVRSAAKVLKDGAPALVKAVETGRAKVSAAAAVAALPQDQQEQLAAAGPAAIAAAAKRVRAGKGKARDLAQRIDAVALFRRTLQTLIDDAAAGRGIVAHAAELTPNARRAIAAELKRLAVQIASWITQLEKENARL